MPTQRLAFLQTSKPLPDPHTHCTGEKTEAEAEVDVGLESLGFVPVQDGVLAVSPEPGT